MLPKNKMRGLKMTASNHDFIIEHLREALVAGLAEAEGNEKLSRKLRARTKLRLITMSEDELREFAGLSACLPERPVDKVYQQLVDEVEKLRQTGENWKNDIRQNNDINLENGKNNIILSIANNPCLESELVSIFKQDGFRVFKAHDYSQILQKLYQCRIDLIIMSSNLPDCNAFTACYEFRSFFSIPVILLGEETDDIIQTRIEKSNADYYETLPCNFTDLLNRARSILRPYRAKV